MTKILLIATYHIDWETPPFVESLAMDKSVLDDFEVLRQMNNVRTLLHFKYM